MRCPFFFFKVTFYGIKRTPYFFDVFFRVKVFSFQFYQKRGHLLGSWLYFDMYIKGSDYRKNGLRSTKQKGTA